MKTEAIRDFVDQLNEIICWNPDNNSVTANIEFFEKICKTIDRIGGLDHGTFSTRGTEFVLRTPLIKECVTIANAVRRKSIVQMSERDYSAEDIERCMKDFKYAKNQAYDEGGGSNWSGIAIADKATKNICRFLFSKIEIALSGKIHPKEKQKLFDYLQKIHDNHNGGDDEYHIAEKLLGKYKKREMV